MNAPVAVRVKSVAGSELVPGQLAQLARLHAHCLPGSLFSQLGDGAVRCLYRFMAGSPQELFVLAFDAQDAVVGASVTSLQPHTLLRRLLVHSSMAWWLLRCGHRLSWRHLGASDPAPPRPELMFLFVAPQARHGGTGQALVRQTEEACRARAVSVLTVKTEDRADNAALGFYERLGYRRESTVAQYGQPFALFSLAL